MFNFFRKPKAIIVISRQTGQEEAASITVNSYSLDRNSIYKALTEAGEALGMRLRDHNNAILEMNAKIKEEQKKELPTHPKFKK